MDVSVIIVSYNSHDVLRPCLDALRNQRFDGDCEVIVVDNASSDGTPDMIREAYPWVRLFAGTENLGYSKGVNIGIRAATGRYFFILNPDTVVAADAVAQLAAFMEATPDAGIVGPKLVFYDGNTQLSCRRFYTFKVLLLRRTPLGKLVRDSKAVRDHLMVDFDHNSTVEVDWILGAAMFVRREAVAAVGLMDERFFLYFEDVDWCYRMKQNGLKVYYHHEAVVTHGYQRESAQSVLNRSFVSHLVSLFRFYEKWNFLFYFLKRYREFSKVTLFAVLDVIAFNAAFVTAYFARVALNDVFTNPLFPIARYGQFVLFENLLFLATFAVLGLYRVRRETRYSDELFDLARAVIYASVILMTSTYLGQVRTYSRLVVAFTAPFAVFYAWLLRSGVRRLHRRILALKVDLKRVCVVGPKDRAQEVQVRLMRDDTLGYDVVGVIDTAGQSDGILTGTLGALDDVDRIVDRHRLQEVIVLPGAVSEEWLSRLVGIGKRRALDVTVLTDYSGLVFHKPQIGDLLGRPVISYPRDTTYAFRRALKRALDAVVGCLFVVVAAPLYVIYSLYTLSRGAKPLTYSDRAGRGGAPVTIPMAGSNPERGASDFVNLPLFWLVVIGRLSLVGPLALPLESAESLSSAEKFRFEVRPGVTGLWRMGSKASLDDLLAQDAGYIRSWSVWLDLKVALMTLPAMLAGRRRSIAVGPRTSPPARSTTPGERISDA